MLSSLELPEAPHNKQLADVRNGSFATEMPCPRRVRLPANRYSNIAPQQLKQYAKVAPRAKECESSYGGYHPSDLLPELVLSEQELDASFDLLQKDRYDADGRQQFS